MSVHDAMGSALYTALAAGTALTTALGGTAIYHTLAPKGTARPYVVYQQTSGSDENSSPRRAKSYIWTIKAVTEGEAGLAQAEAIDDLIDGLIHGKALTLTGWGNYWTARTSEVSYSEVSTGAVIWHVGAMYRIRIAE